MGAREKSPAPRSEAQRCEQASEMAEALALNPRLRGEYFVRHFAGCRQDFLLAPGSEREAEAADQAVSLALAFLDRHVPEGVAAGVPR